MLYRSLGIGLSSLVALMGCAHRAPAPVAPVAPVAPAPAERTASVAAPERRAAQFAWPAQTALEVHSKNQRTMTNGTTEGHEGHYVLAYQELDGGIARFWEGGPFGKPDDAYGEALEEVGAYPYLRIDNGTGALEIRGMDAWVERMLATPALQGTQFAAIRNSLQSPGFTPASVSAELTLEWYFIVGMWRPFALVDVRVAVQNGDAAAAVTRFTDYAFDLNAEKTGGYTFGGTIKTNAAPDRILVDAHYDSTDCNILLPTHFYRLIAVPHGNFDSAHCKLDIFVESDRATLLPLTSRAEWSITVRDASGEHTGTATIAKTYRRTGWEQVRWAPVD